MKNTLRLNMEIPGETKDRLVALKAATGSTTMTEVLRRMISLHEKVLAHEKEGGSLVLRDKDGNETVILLL